MNGGRIFIVALLLGAFLAPILPASSDEASDAHPAGACSAPFYVTGAGWDFCWQQDDPRAQGLEINQVYFQGQSVIWKMGNPFSMTKYDTPTIGPYKDTLGSPGAGGHPGYGLGSMVLPASSCPRFFGGVGTLLNGGKICVETRGGPEPAVAIWTRYNIYNYRFMHGYLLDSRGHIEPIIRLGGLLIDGNGGAAGNNHFHHLLFRVDFDIGPAGNDQFQSFQRVAGGAQLSGAHTNSPVCETADGAGSAAIWCGHLTEGTLLYDPVVFSKWRVRDTASTNSVGRTRSFEFKIGSDGAANHFSSFDVMVVQYVGDSSELGYEVGTNPYEGDKMLYRYLVPGTSGVITDPVVWMTFHSYHDTRDEDRSSMSYHHVSPEIQPNNFFATNPGEGTYP